MASAREEFLSLGLGEEGLSTVAGAPVTEAHRSVLVVAAYQAANPVGLVPGALRHVASSPACSSARSLKVRLHRWVVCVPVALDKRQKSRESVEMDARTD